MPSITTKYGTFQLDPDLVEKGSEGAADLLRRLGISIGDGPEAAQTFNWRPVIIGGLIVGGVAVLALMLGGKRGS